MGPSSARNPGIPWGLPDFKKPSKPSGARYDLIGRCEALEIFGPMRPPGPSKTRSGTKDDLYRLSAASMEDFRAPWDALEPNQPFAPWGLGYDFGAPGNLET